MHRREFIKLTGATALPLLAPRLAFSATGDGGRDTLVVIFQRGAADGLNIVAPVAEGRYHDLRPTLALPAPGSPGGALDLDGFFGLHPALAPLLPAWEAGELAFVHAAGSPDDSRSHFDAQDYMEYGVASRDLVADGWLNRHLASIGLAGDSPFEAVGIGNAVPLALRGSLPALGITGIESFDLLAPEAEYAPLRRALEALHGGQGAVDSVGTGVFDVVDVLRDAVGNLPASTVTYPEGPLGGQLATVASLIRAGVGLEAAAVDVGGWDHHDREAPQLAGLLEGFGAALAAFREDLGPAMDRVTVLVMTEFGRRAAENASAGTDHGHGSVMLALGGGVNGGLVHGAWPGLGAADLYRGDLAITTDYRTVISEALQARRGEDAPGAVFPGFEGPSALGLFTAR